MKRSPLKRKRPLQATKPVKGTAAPKHGKARKTPLRPKKRTVSEALRIYGPPERRESITKGRCVGCKTQGTDERPLHQHHTRNGGNGRKADASTIVGLCWQCHEYLHDQGPKAYEKAAKLDLRAEAARVQSAWEARQTEGTP